MLTFFALLITLFFSPVNVPSGGVCDSIHTLVGGEPVEWVGYPQGWNLPADLKASGHVDFQTGGVISYYSKSERTRYLFVFTSYEANADSNGEHHGNHDFCGPYRIPDD